METVCDRYILKDRIGHGSFGEIYVAEEIQTGKEYAAKIENASIPVPQLIFESRIYEFMSGCTNVPRIYFADEGLDQNIMIIDLLGKSLEKLKSEFGTFSLKTVLMLADQMISAVQFFHEKSYLHRDIKPDNFVFGRGKEANKLYIIDYGLCKRYRDPNTHKHVKFTSGKSLTGTARYASVNALLGCEQSRRDDMEGLGYVFVYLLKGSLPWMGVEGKTRAEKFKNICETKKTYSLRKLCEGLPPPFLEYLWMVKNLKFEDEPDYSYYRKLFRDLMIRNGFVYDYVYDWTKKKEEEEENVFLVPPPPLNIEVPRKSLRRRRKKNELQNTTDTEDTKIISMQVMRTNDFHNTFDDYVPGADCPLPKVPKIFNEKRKPSTTDEPQPNIVTATLDEKNSVPKKRLKKKKNTSLTTGTPKPGKKVKRKRLKRKQNTAAVTEQGGTQDFQAQETDELFETPNKRRKKKTRKRVSKPKISPKTAEPKKYGGDVVMQSVDSSFIEIPAMLIFNEGTNYDVSPTVTKGKRIKAKKNNKKKRSRSVDVNVRRSTLHSKLSQRKTEANEV